MFSAIVEVSALEFFIRNDKTQSLTLEFSSDSKSTELCFCFVLKNKYVRTFYSQVVHFVFTVKL
jgi:hypothetical protein